MATGVCKVFVEGGSEETFEFICTSCKETKIVEAEKYCQDCDEHYCLICVDLHKRFPSLRNHMILNREDVTNWREQTKIPTIPTETCDRHPGKLVELFCGQHKELCCHICVSLDHRICEGILYIAETAKGIDESEDFKAVKANVKEMKADLEMTTSKQQGSLENSRCKILEQIAAFRKRTKEIFDDLEKKVTDETDMLARDSSSRHIAYQKACNDILQQVLQFEQLLQSTRTTNEPQTFINMKKCQFQIPKIKEAVEELKSQYADDQLLFEIDRKLENFIGNLERLGTVTLSSTVSSTSKPPTTNDVNMTTEASTQNTDLPSQQTSTVHLVPSNQAINTTQAQTPTSHLKVSQFKNYTTKIQSDKKGCDIFAICLMANGTIVLTDHENSKIKCMNASYEITDYLTLNFAPYQVSCINNHSVVVASRNKLLNFVDVKENMLTFDRSVKLSHLCLGVAYNGGRLFVSDCDNKVYIHTMEGKHLKTIKMDGSYQNIFFSVRQLASSLDGSKLFVSDKKGIIVLDKEGEMLSAFEDNSQDGAEGICVNIEGQVFVCYFDSGKISEMNNDGTQHVNEVIKLASHEHPVALCIDDRRKTFIVALHTYNFIRVYDVVSMKK